MFADELTMSGMATVGSWPNGGQFGQPQGVAAVGLTLEVLEHPRPVVVLATRTSGPAGGTGSKAPRAVTKASTTTAAAGDQPCQVERGRPFWIFDPRRNNLVIN